MTERKILMPLDATYYCTMCHEYHTEWTERSQEYVELVEEPEELAEEETPSYLEQEEASDVEILTDGGDGDAEPDDN